jgi:threonine dehydrogenase-like Zn-dependent dehydrogenase
MKAVVYQDVRDVTVGDVPDPWVEEPGDAVVRITAAAICGSDLHFYNGRAPLMPGDIIGHEAVGVVEQVGAGVRLGVYWTRMLRFVFSGICPIHAWWDRAMAAVADGSIDPLPIISHRLPLADVARGYELFDSREATKVVLLP